MTTNTRTIPFTGTSQTINNRVLEREYPNHHPRIMERFFRRTNSRTRQLEQIVNMDSNLKVGSNSRIDYLNPRQLYNLNWLNTDVTSLYRYRREVISIFPMDNMRLLD